MSRQGTNTSQGRPRFRSTKYSTLFRKNKNSIEHQESQLQNNGHNSTINVQRFGKLVDFNIKRKSMPFTSEVSLNSQEYYLKTFNSFMSNKFDKQNQKSIETDTVLTHYKSHFDQKQSNFTLLDVIIKPITFVDDEIFSLNKELKNQTQKAEIIKSELFSLDLTMRKQLEYIQNSTMSKLGELRKLLKSSEIIENQRKMRNKKQINQLQKGHILNKNKLQSLKQRNLDIQTLIFDCQPLQLQFQRQNAAQKVDEYL